MLAEKVNAITSLIEKEGGNVNFSELSRVLRDGLEATGVYVISQSGKVLGSALAGDFETTSFDADWLPAGRVSEELSAWLERVKDPQDGSLAAQIFGDRPGLVFPIVGSGRRVGSLMFVREAGDEAFNGDAFLIGKIASMVLGVVIAQAIDEEEEGRAEEKRMARSAVQSLSYSETVAVHHIFDALQGDEGLLVASRIADAAGITRSVIVNALRKLASANVIESRSLGMKGTYLRIRNRELRRELERHREPYMSSPAHIRKRA